MNAPDATYRKAFAEARLPWYDAPSDRVRPMLSWPDFGTGWWKFSGDWWRNWTAPFRNWFRSLNGWRVPWIGGLGDLIVTGMALLFLTLLLVVLLELLRRYRPLPGDEADAKRAVKPGTARRIEGLPAGVRLEGVDPWQEALRRKERGDYAGAVVYLFAHQLVTLERLKRLRLVPGRTGRQLVRTVADRALRETVEPTLRLFEAVYYGHHVPSAEAFAAVWSAAEGFEGRAAGAAS